MSPKAASPASEFGNHVATTGSRNGGTSIRGASKVEASKRIEAARLLARGGWKSLPQLPPISDDEWLELADSLGYPEVVEEFAGLREEWDDVFGRFFRIALLHAVVEPELTHDVHTIERACISFCASRSPIRT
jgi:hypothetical protein